MAVTLTCISNINHTLTEFALNKSIECRRFEQVLVIADRPLTGVKYQHTYHCISDILSNRNTPEKPVEWNFDLYNIFLLKGLNQFIDTSHVLNIHYDGFCVNNSHWSDEFLEWDYIGSPTSRDWPPLQPTLKFHDLYKIAPAGWYNGGGGFSLRSKKLLQALTDSRISTELSSRNWQRCEDVTISIKYRRLLENEYGIKFAPLDICLRFSTELLTGLNYSFGFHGWFNIPLFLSEPECIWYLDNLDRRDVFKGSPVVGRYIAMCTIQGYSRAIDHINTLVHDTVAIARKQQNYNR